MAKDATQALKNMKDDERKKKLGNLMIIIGLGGAGFAKHKLNKRKKNHKK